MKNLLPFIFLLFLSVAAWGQTLVGKVVSLADGDTFTVLVGGHRQVKVRLHGVDCPERRQDFGSRAQQFTSSLIAGKVVRVQVKNKDRYGRTIGIVQLDNNRVLNEELLKAGMAWHYKRYDQSREWAKLELQARTQKKGLWSMKNPVAPWDFRRYGLKGNQKSLIKPSDEHSVASPCGAPTNAGGSCRRQVTGGGRCYQHT